MGEPLDTPESAGQAGRLERVNRSVAESPIFQGLTKIAGQLTGYALEAQYPGASVAVPAAVTTVKTGIAVTLTRMRRRRVNVLNETLVTSGVDLATDVIQSEEFLHCYAAVLWAALQTQREEKIDLFARLLASATKSDAITYVDEFEELLSILVDLSVREIVVLELLVQHESDSPWHTETGELELERAYDHWPEYLRRLEEVAGVKKQEASAVLTRLTRAGLYETFPGYGEYGRITMGYVTLRYYRLRQLIQDRGGNVIAPDPAAPRPMAPPTSLRAAHAAGGRQRS